MAKKKKILAKLQCQECKTTNYFTNKSRGVEEKLEFKKFCKSCRKHTLHKELKKK